MKSYISSDSRGFDRFREIWRYRELLLMLSFRDFKVRYSQTAIGVLWAFIQPFLTLIIFIFVFSKAIKVDTGGIPYPLFAFSGIMGWTYFSFVLSQAGTSIISSQSLVSKIYFPRLIIPFSKAIVGLIDLGISFLFMLFLIIFYDYQLSYNLVFLPLFLLLLMFFSNAVGVFFSAVTIRFRDMQYVIPFIVQLGLYATPVAYPANLISGKYRWLYDLNPMTGIIGGIRWCITGYQLPDFSTIISSIVISLLLMILSLWLFTKVEDVIADIV